MIALYIILGIIFYSFSIGYSLMIVLHLKKKYSEFTLTLVTIFAPIVFFILIGILVAKRLNKV